MSEMINLWLYAKSPNTRAAYERDVHSFMAFTEGRNIQAWTVNDLQAFGDALTQQGMKPNTVNRKMLSVKSLLTYAHKLGLIRANAGAAVPVSTIKNELAQRILTEDQVMGMIYQTTKPLHRAWLKMLYATGCRVSELINLKWCDAVDRGELVQLTISGKGGKTRQILIKSPLWAEVQTATGVRGDFVFSTANGKPWDRKRVDNLIKSAGERIGLKGVSAHWFRHSNASHSLDRGCPIHTVQNSLGHSSIETTQRYLHARPEDSAGLYLAI
jgi:integrase/recombinase XerD